MQVHWQATDESVRNLACSIDGEIEFRLNEKCSYERREAIVNAIKDYLEQSPFIVDRVNSFTQEGR